MGEVVVDTMFANVRRAMRALRDVSDAGCVIDVAAERIAWLFDFVAGQHCARAVLSNARNIIELVVREYAAGTVERLVGLSAADTIEITGVADLGRLSELDDAPCVALGIAPLASCTVLLSTREREVASLLIAGYSAVNAAAILSLSESSIRTYVRRLYRKLDVTNRADLTRKCIALSVCGS